MSNFLNAKISRLAFHRNKSTASGGATLRVDWRSAPVHAGGVSWPPNSSKTSSIRRSMWARGSGIRCRSDPGARGRPGRARRRSPDGGRHAADAGVRTRVRGHAALTGAAVRGDPRDTDVTDTACQSECGAGRAAVAGRGRTPAGAAGLDDDSRGAWGHSAEPAADGSRLAPPPETGPPLFVRPGGAIKEPRKIHDASPVLPAIAISAKAEGLVIVEAVIDKNGDVVDAKVLRSHPLLDQAALDAVRQWKSCRHSCTACRSTWT